MFLEFYKFIMFEGIGGMVGYRKRGRMILIFKDFIIE